MAIEDRLQQDIIDLRHIVTQTIADTRKLIVQHKAILRRLNTIERRAKNHRHHIK